MGHFAFVTPQLITWARERANISVKELASKLKVDPRTVSAWEEGEQAPPFGKAETLADGWIIAHAKHDLGTVVSHESRVDKASLTPKIPNVCTDFGVRCISLAEMLNELGFKFKK